MLQRRATTKAKNRSRFLQRLRVETLETRLLMSGDPFTTRERMGKSARHASPTPLIARPPCRRGLPGARSAAA